MLSMVLDLMFDFNLLFFACRRCFWQYFLAERYLV